MTANRDQADYWSGAPGRKWIDFATDLDAMHAGVLDLLLEHAALKAGEHILDIGCGAGASSLDAARQVGPTGSVMGLDISAPLLDFARERAVQEGLTNIEFVHGDAQVIHPEPPVDALISRFGMMFFDDPARAFTNLAAAVCPGGRLVFAAWCGPEENPWFSTARQVAARHLPADDAPADPHAPGPMAFADGGRVVDLMRGAGLSEAGYTSHDVDLRPDGGLEAAVALAQRVGPVGRQISLHNPGAAVRQALEEDLRNSFAELSGPGAFSVPARVHIFAART